MSTYSFETHSKTSQIRISDPWNANSTLLFDDPAYSEPTWIGDTDILLVRTGDRGITTLFTADVTRPDARLAAQTLPRD